MAVGFYRVGMVCVVGVARVLGIWGKVGHGNGHASGKYPTEPEKAGGVGCGLRPSHKFS